MNSHARPSFPRRLPRLPLAILPALALILVCATLPALHAQTASKSGSITGRVFNPATDEYVRDAQIRNAATGETIFTAAGGFYEMSGLPAGEATIVLSYAGLPDVARTVTITAGATTTLNLELPLPTGPTTAATTDDVVQLEKFTVTSEREGQAKVIMRERASLDIGTSVSSDLFGSDPEGNIGEFLRNIPGIFVNTNGGEAQSVSIGGLPSEYTNIMVDGVSVTAANFQSTDARSTGFELISLNSMESIDIARTISADVDANAPAGTINLRSKSAFDRRGTHFATRLVLNAHSTALTFDKTLGPSDDRASLKIRPGLLASFSTAVKNKFGLLINISESNIYSQTNALVLGANYEPTAADPRLQVPTSLLFRQMPRTIHRFAANIRADWRITPRLSVGAAFNYNASDRWHKQRNLTFSTPGRTATSLTTLLGDQPMYAFETTGNVTSESRDAVETARYYAPEARLEYRLRNLVLDARVNYADSKSWGDSFGKKGSAYIVRAVARNVRYRVTRTPGDATEDFTVTQLSGPDIGTGESFTNSTTIYMQDGRETTAKVFTGQINASLMTRWLWPIHWKAGLKTRTEKRTFDQTVHLTQQAYRDTSAANIAALNGSFKSDYDFDFGRGGASVATLGGGTVWIPDTAAAAKAWKEDQEREDDDKIFQNTVSADQYYNAYVYYHRNFRERIDAGYLMATTQFLNKTITVRAGLRYEDTVTRTIDPDSRTSEEVIDYVNSLPSAEQAPYKSGTTIVNTSGRAVTIPGIDYQFLSRPWRHNIRNYDNIFPSASAKWSILQNLNLQAGFSTTIRRPSYSDLLGVTIVDSDDSIISVPNRNLKPENARNYALRLAWYPRGAGALSVAVYRNEVKSKIQTDEQRIEDYDPSLATQYPGFLVRSRFNTGGLIAMNSMELGWRRNLGFIAPSLRSITLRANYTRTQVDKNPDPTSPYVAYVVPHSFNAGITYNRRGFNININYNWADDFPTTVTGLSLRRHRSQTDISGDWRFNRHYTLSFSIRNVFDDRYVWQKKVAPGPLALDTIHHLGSVISLSVKGEW